jgi:hypothetical protein
MRDRDCALKIAAFTPPPWRHRSRGRFLESGFSGIISNQDGVATEDIVRNCQECRMLGLSRKVFLSESEIVRKGCRLLTSAALPTLANTTYEECAIYAHHSTILPKAYPLANVSISAYHRGSLRVESYPVSFRPLSSRAGCASRFRGILRQQLSPATSELRKDKQTTAKAVHH